MEAKGIIKAGAKKPPRIVLYGPPKIGKSTFGANAPNPIFVTTEDGIDNLTCDRFPRADSWDQLMANVAHVVKNPGQYKTIVLDTLNGAAGLAAEMICKEQFKGVWGEKGFAGFGRGWTATAEEMKKVLPLMDTARDKGMTVIILAHTGIQNVKNPIDGDFSRYAPDVDKKVWGRFAAWSDIIVRADYETSIIDTGNKRYKAVSSNSRILRCQGSAAEDVGTRVGFDLPEIITFGWKEFEEAVGKNTGLIAQVEERMGLLNEEETKATMKWLGVKETFHSFPDMAFVTRNLAKADREKLKQLLNKLIKREADIRAAKSAPKEDNNG